MEALVDWLASQQADGNWVVKSFVVIFISLFLNYLLGKFFNHLQVHSAKTKNLWDDSLIASAKQPLRYFVLLIGARIVLKILESELDPGTVEMIRGAFKVGIIALVAWFAIRFISEAENNLKSPGYTKEPMDETTVTAISKLLRASVIITAALVVAQSMGYSVSGVLA
ncbi:MAG: hypothetical protein R3208_04335, partial [Ketobacteraceae bacterium]|nr:hypothetical protein [Ketobacteraceae bacterium]